MDNVRALINLSLLTGHVGRYGSGVCPLRGQNNVQGGGDMGALPDRLPGFQHVENDELRAQVRARLGRAGAAEERLASLRDVRGHGARRADRPLRDRREPRELRGGPAPHRRAPAGLETLVVQDMLLTATAELADVVLPAAAGWCESEGTVTNSERRVQRVRRALPPPPGVRDDIEILCELARRMGRDLGNPTAEELWNELRALSPAHAGMSYARLEAADGLQWPCYDETHPGELYLHGRLWERPVVGPRAPFAAVEHDPPVDELTDEYPLRLTTGRHLDSYNTGVQTGLYASPNRRARHRRPPPRGRPATSASPPATSCGSSRGAGAVEAPVRFDPGLRPGLVFMTLHFPEQVATNELTIDAVDPRSGTSEFKATAVRIEPVGALVTA